jgi:hypothetical protein
MENRQYNLDYLNKPKLDQNLEIIAKELRKKKKDDFINQKRVISTFSQEPTKERSSLLSSIIPDYANSKEPSAICTKFIEMLIKNQLNPTREVKCAIMWYIATNLMGNLCYDIQFNKSLTEIGIIDYIAKTAFSDGLEYEEYCLTIINNLCSIYAKACRVTIESDLLIILASRLNPPFGPTSYIYFQIFGNIASNGINERDKVIQMGIVDYMKNTLFLKDIDARIIREITFCMFNLLLYKPYPPDKQINDIVQFSCRTLLTEDKEIVLNSLAVICTVAVIGKSFLGEVLTNGIMQAIVKLFESPDEQISKKAIEVVHNICCFTVSEVQICLESNALKKLLKILVTSHNEELKSLIISAIDSITVEAAFSEFIYSQDTYEVLVKMFLSLEPISFRDGIIIAICHGILQATDEIMVKICTGDCIDCIIESLRTNAMNNKKSQIVLKCINRMVVESKDESIKQAFKCKGGYEELLRYQYFPDVSVFSIAKDILDKEDQSKLSTKTLL